MTSKPEYQHRKLVFFRRITPEMSKEHIVRALIDALEKSGITVKQDMDIAADEKGGDE
jgi:hypothetical protein